MPTFDDLRGEYAQLWASTEIRPERDGQARRAAAKVIAGRAHYEAVGGALGVPWYFIGLAHMRESYCSFGTHLHNGDSLSARTYHVPAGRPAKGSPPFSWDESAIDALQIKGLQNVGDWPIERVCYELERFNGFGYRRPGRGLSPYLWADTNHYQAGKFIADGKYSSGAVDRQDGCMAVLKIMVESDPSILGGAPEADEAISAPKASEEPGEGLAHPEIHTQLKEESWWYSGVNWVRKKLGLPAAGATVGASMLDDPMQALSMALSFVKSYGLFIVAGAVAILLAVEAMQAAQRERAKR